MVSKNYCMQCGAELKENADFCTECGVALKTETAPNITEAYDESKAVGENRFDDMDIERAETPIDKAKQLRSLISCISFALIISFVVKLMLVFLGLNVGGTQETITDYLVAYLPDIIVLVVICRKYPLVKPGQWPVKWTNPSLLLVISWVLFDVGMGAIVSPVKLSAAVTWIEIGLQAPGFLFSVSRSGIFSLSTMGAIIFAPILEEYIYRRLMLDRLVVYGEGIAVLITALLFSLGHLSGNMLYTFIGGIVYGYIHVKTGKMRWNILLHMIYNATYHLFSNMTGLMSVFICVSAISVPIYLIRHKPWRDFIPGDSGLLTREKVRAWLTSIPFWLCTVFYLLLIIWRG